MDAEHWQRVQDLFLEAVERPEPERMAFVRAQSDDIRLVNDVLALLAEDEASHPLLDRNLPDVAHRILHEPAPVDETVGPYRLVRRLGQGGMGVVYLAERADLGSMAALKFLRDASLSPARRERFDRERQTLAQLTHPSIARLYDASALPDGTPYFVMEYVDGLPLTEYCSRNNLSIRARLGLFRRVCEAVQYAHGRAIVHRDLKPSNIMVVAKGNGADPEVKLLDFGIAKHLETLDAPDVQTRTGAHLMTPAYAAPEQITGEPVGVYTDVYALGTVLYELLTGGLPFDLSGKTAGEIERLVLQREPEKPSERVRKNAQSSPANGRPNSIGQDEWADLDVICLKAMHKEQARRYATVEALIRDIDHFLRGEPVDARPDSLGYRARKFVRRNRQPVAAGSAVFLVILGLVVFYTLQLRSARDAALAETARTQRIQQFMLNLFQGGDTAVGPADTLRVITLVNEGVREARLLDAEPDIQADLYYTLGGIYQKLGNLTLADSLLTAAFDQRSMIYGEDHPDVAAALVAMGLLRAEQAEMEEAERLVRQGHEMVRTHLPAEHPAVIEAATALGQVLQERGSYDEAIVVLEDAMRKQRTAGAAAAGLSESVMLLASSHFYAGNLDASDSLNRIGLDMNRRLYGEHHPRIADGLINLGAIQFERGRYEQAEAFYRHALDIMLSFYGPQHPSTASNMTILARSLVFQERYDDAIDLLEQALDVRERVYGENHPQVASTLNELGVIATGRGDLATAQSHYTRMAEIYKEAFDDRHYLIGIALSNLGGVHVRSGRYAEAEAIFREVIDRFTDTLSDSHLNTAIAQIRLGNVLVRQNRHAEAEGHLLAGYDLLSEQVDPAMVWLQIARADLVAVYEGLNQSERLEHFRAEQARMEQTEAAE